MLTAATVTIAKMWNQPRCPKTAEQIEKMWDICTILCPIAQVFGHVQFRPNMMKKITIMGNKYRRGFSVDIIRRGHGERRLYCVKRRNVHCIYT
jgi:hypothetical protein